MATRLTIGFAAGLMAFFMTAGAAGDNPGGWMTEPGVSPPSYAVTIPLETDLNVDTVALVCTEATHGRSLELNLYLADTEPLLPKNADPLRLKDSPSVEIEIDGRPFQADLLFTDGYVVVADDFADSQPQLSRRLLDAMQTGNSMVLRFDLLNEEAGQRAGFDGRLLIDLAAGGVAIRAVRRCVLPQAYEASR